MYEVKSESEYKEKRSFGENLKWFISKFFDKLQVIVMIAVVGVVLYLVLFTIHEVDGRSMHPTYADGEYLLANRLTYNLTDPKHGDVVIFKRSETQDYIKRVLGVPGDTVSIRNGALYVNNKKVDESSYLDGVLTGAGPFLKEGTVATVPDGYYFVVGDNRPHSSDSRAFGMVAKEDIKAKVFFVFYPLGEMRWISAPEFNETL